MIYSPPRHTPARDPGPYRARISLSSTESTEARAARTSSAPPRAQREEGTDFVFFVISRSRASPRLRRTYLPAPPPGSWPLSALCSAHAFTASPAPEVNAEPPISICARSAICAHCFSAAAATSAGQRRSPRGSDGGGARVSQNGEHRGTACSFVYTPSGNGGKPGGGGNGAAGAKGTEALGAHVAVPRTSRIDEGGDGNAAFFDGNVVVGVVASVRSRPRRRGGVSGRWFGRGRRRNDERRASVVAPLRGPG